MKLREYQAKEIFASHGIPIPKGFVADTPAQALSAWEKIQGPVVLKPQLGVKGRGKVGGIAFAHDADEVLEKAEQLFQMTIKGEHVQRLWVESKANIQKELYVAVTLDPIRQLPVLVASSQGGVDIEEVSKNNPDAVVMRPVSILNGPDPKDWEAIARVIGVEAQKVLQRLYQIFVQYDAVTAEINPLVLTREESILAVDAVLNIDEDALFRHPELKPYDIHEQDPLVLEAKSHSWTYIELDGDIGILSSGAGLTMAILDILRQQGGRAANFLDTAQIDAQGIYEAFGLLLKGKPLRGILVNIFAGLNRCDQLAEGIVKAMNHYDLPPVVIRMIGNRDREGFDILSEHGIEVLRQIEDAVARLIQKIEGGQA